MSNVKEIKIKIEGQEWENAIDTAYEKAHKKAKIDGFRPGKAPKDLFLKKYGKENLYMDAADTCLQSSYEKVLKENKELEIVAQPEIEIESMDEKGLSFTFKLTLKPEIKLGNYKGLGIKKESTEVSKEEIDHTILEMRSRFSESVLKEGSANEGDTIVIDFEGSIDGVPFEGGTSTNYTLKLGSHTFIPGFEEQLIGLKKDDEKDVIVTFPDDYHAEELKGKEATFKVKVHEVKETVIPEIDESFFEDLGLEGINTIEALETQVKENLEARKKMNVENKFMDDLLEAASKNVELEIPDAMLEDELHRMLHQFEDNLKMQGLDLKTFFQFTHSNEDALKDQMKEEATKRITYRLMLEAIAKNEKVEIKEEDAMKEAEGLASRYEMERDEFLKEFGGIEMVKYDLMMRKSMELLKENNGGEK